MVRGGEDTYLEFPRSHDWPPPGTVLSAREVIGVRNPWSLWLSVGLALLAGAALAQATVGEAPALRVVSVQSEKVLYGLKEPVKGAVTVGNAGKEPAQVMVSAWLEWEVDQSNKPQTATLSVEPGKTAVAAFVWKQAPARYGHALKAEVSVRGRKLGAGEDYFNVCDNYWNVALPWAVGFMWDAYDQKMMPKADPAWVERYLGEMRKGFYNCFEHFFWAQDDFLGMVPTKEVWWSGQARYRESVSAIKLLIDRSHDNGIKATTYAKLTGAGPFGMDVARRHPEWVWQSGGTLAVDRNVQQIHDWDTTTEKHWSGWVPVNYNMNVPAVVDIGIKNLSDSATFFDWDGARWDGNFDVWSEVYDLEGKLVEKLTPDQVDARNAANMRRTKDYITKVHPQFRYGYNWTQGNWQQSMATSPRESTELCRGGGLIMNEYINQAAGVQHPLHRWEVYGPSVADDVEAIKALGGYYGPILTSENNPDGKYTNVFAYAAGAHPYYHHLWGEFVTRNSAFLWDNALKRVHGPENLVLVSSGVWWRNWVFERPVDASRKQLIVHLINPPAKPNVGESKAPEDMPPPLKSVEVRVLPGLLAGWTPVRAACLSPEPALRETLPVEAVEGVYKCTVPEVALWNVVVIDLQKGGR